MGENMSIDLFLSPLTLLERERQAYMVGNAKEAALMASLAALEAEKEKAEDKAHEEYTAAWQKKKELEEAIKEAIYYLEMDEKPKAFKYLQRALECIS